MPLAGAWVNRWQVSLPPLPLPLPHLQSFVSLRYRTFLLGTENAVGGHGSLAVYAILFSQQAVLANFSCSIEIFLFTHVVCSQFILCELSENKVVADMSQVPIVCPHKSLYNFK